MYNNKINKCELAVYAPKMAIKMDRTSQLNEFNSRKGIKACQCVYIYNV